MSNKNKSYDFFEHTADIGIRASGATHEELFVHMAQGLMELLVEDSPIEPRQRRSIAVDAEDVELLLLAWLKELLFWSAVDRFLPAAYAIHSPSTTSLHGTVRGETFDTSRHVQGREVKAITRHLLEVRQRKGIWYGQVVVDI